MENTNILPTLPLEKNAHTLRMYLIFWIGQLVSLFGSSVVQFAFAWYLTSQSDNPIYMSIFMFISFLPHIFLGPLAGVVADRYDRKKVILIADSFQAIITLALILITNWVPLSLTLLIGAIAIRYLGQCFHFPAVSAVAATMVPDDKLGQINGIKGFAGALVQMGAPFVRALLINRFSLIQIFWIDVITFGLATIPLLFIKIPKVHPTEKAQDQASESKPKTSYYRDFIEGMKTVKETPGLSVLIATAIFNNLLITPLNVLNSYLILYEHNGTAQQFAIVGIFIQAGIMLGSILMSVKKNWKNRRIHFTLWHYIAFTGYAIIGLAPFGALWLVSLGGFIFLFSIPVINTFYITYMQLSVPKEKQGRIFAIDQALSSIASPIGMLLAAPLANLMGIGNLFTTCAFIAMGIITLFVMTGKMKKIDFDKFDTSVNAENSAIVTESTEDIAIPVEVH